MLVRRIGYVSTVAALLALAAPAGAMAVGGWAGACSDCGYQWYNGTNYFPCLEESFGAVRFASNSCGSGGIYWEIGLPVTSGSHNPTVGVVWPEGNAMSGYIQCLTASQQPTNVGSSYETTGWQYTSATSGNATFQPGSVTVPSGGFLFVECWMNYQTYLVSVNYSK